MKMLRLRLGLLTAVLMVVPVSFSTEHGVVLTEACADGTCCAEMGSICVINDIVNPNGYYKGTGSCINEH